MSLMQGRCDMTDNIRGFKHNSICIESKKGMIYIDPFEVDNSPKDAAYILITHDHYDHFSPEDIEKVACGGTILVVPEKMAGKAGALSGQVSRIETVVPGKSYDIDGLKIETVPMYNILKPFHPKGAGWVGYVVEDCGKRIYIAGDIDAIKEAEAVKCDVALVPAGGFYTMDAIKAAELVNKMQPKVAVPVHYGEIAGKPKDGETFAAHVKPPVKAEILIS